MASDPESRQGRPSPEALLREAAKESRGRFKLFLGAAPGVGKTYEMLRVAQAKREEGVDVVVGVVETHGRAETQALVETLEVVPRRSIEYRGHAITEMDLDAILARHPQLVLVDELAHANAEGSRHPKRYLDVEELLAAGIDVYSTMNVQHVESLNDIVATITQVRVRETVPDDVLELADEIEVIDLTPEALIERLKEGKVYVPQQAQRALQHYFSPGNLTALRELALRATAQRVDDQMLQYMQTHAIAGPWPASDRILVCVGEDARSLELVRYGRRMADRLKAKWTALYVEGPRHGDLGESARDAIAETLRLAERLGGEAITIPGRHIADEVLDYARANNVSHIVIGKSERSRWFEMLHGSVVHDLVRSAGTISVHVLAGEPEPRGPATGVAVEVSKNAPHSWSYLFAALMVAAATGISFFVASAVALPNVALVYLTAILLSALRDGLWPSVFASLASVAAYNFFFLPPLYTFTIQDPANVVNLFFFLVAALIVSHLTGQKQRQTEAMKARGKTTAQLYALSRKIAGIRSLEDLLWVVTHQIAAMLKCDVVVLLPDGEGSLEVRAGYPPEDTLEAADMAAAQWTWTRNHPAGRGADTLPGGKRLFLPLQTERGAIGVVGIQRDKPPLLTPDERRLLDALLDQAAVAIEGSRLAQDVDQVKLQAETERLRNALLTSISHDLRTPLASIIGALTSLRSFGETYDAGTRGELVATAQDEAERLNRFVGNLLDMTRLESGAVVPKVEAIDVGDVVGVALGRARPLLVDHATEIDLASDLPMVKADFVLLEQVIFNLIDNAAKYTPHGTTIRLSGRMDKDQVLIEVIDEGTGIPPASLEAIFDKFTRLQEGDNKRAGTGLGLPICRGFMQAMSGTVTASNRQDRSGAILTVRLAKAEIETVAKAAISAHVA